MTKKTFKKGTAPPFVMLENWMTNSAAWLALKPAPRALYLELKQIFNGGNNGQIFLSQRDAVERLNVGRDTVGRYFNELVEKGFIIKTRGHCLGPSGIGQAATYALTELSLHGKPATKEFMAWEKQKPRSKTQHSLVGKSSPPCSKSQHSSFQKAENTTALGSKSPSTVLDNPATYTSNHIPIANVSHKAFVEHAPMWIANNKGLCGKAPRGDFNV